MNCSGYIRDWASGDRFAVKPCPREVQWRNENTGNGFCDAHREAADRVSTGSVDKPVFTPLPPPQATL